MRTVIVTGGSRGIGLGIARELATSGYQVIAIARRETEAFAAARSERPDALYFRAGDLSKIDTLGELVRALHSEFGPLYGLVNNAGLGTSGILASMPDTQIAQLLQLNLSSLIVLTKYVVRAMMVDGGSRIVNIGSIVGRTGYNGLSVYSATKAALEGFTRSLARELGPLGITVNTVAPGFIATDMTGELNPGDRDRIARRSALRRMAETQDVAATVGFLLSDAARNVTGTVVTVDAGNTA